MKVKVLTMQVDVSELSQDEVDDLRAAMIAQTEDFEGIAVISDDVRTVDEDGEEEDEEDYH